MKYGDVTAYKKYTGSPLHGLKPHEYFAVIANI